MNARRHVAVAMFCAWSATAGAGTGNLLCGTGPVCRTMVPVHATATGCEVRWPLASIEVPKGTRKRLVWRLVKENGADPASYFFDAQRGIELIGNDPAQDLDEPGYEGTDRATFRWRSLNRRARDINFNFVVYRAEAGGGRTPCAFVDPVIVNRGN